MSNGLATTTLLAEIAAAVLAAWPGVKTSYDKPLTAQSAGCCSITPLDVEVSLNGPLATMGNTHQANRFQIWGTFAWPSDPTQIISVLKVTAANELIAQLQTGPSFGSYGVMPVVTQVEFGIVREPNEQVYDVMLEFQVWTQASHH